MNANDILAALVVAAGPKKEAATVTEIVDVLISEFGGSREYVTRRVRDTLRELGRKGKVFALRKTITTQSGYETQVPAYKEKAR